MKELHLKVEMVCEDASTIEYGSGSWFGGVGPRFEGRRLTYDSVFGAEALHITGVFRAQTADGAYKNTQASLTDTEQAQLRTTGELTWTANRVALDRVAEIGSARGADVLRRVSDGRGRTVSSIG